MNLLLPCLVALVSWCASLALLQRLHPTASLPEKLALSVLPVMAYTVLQVMLLGVLWSGYRFPFVLLLDAAALATLLALRRDFVALVRQLFAVGRELAAAPLSLLPAALALSVWAAAIPFTFYAPVPGMDALNYHLPMATFLKQEGALRVYETIAGHTNEFPKNGQFLSAHLITLGADERLVRFVQWSFGFFAMAALAAMMRALGVSRLLALTLASLYGCIPGVLNQPYRLWGTVDLIFHSVVLVALMLLVLPSRSPREAWTRALLTVLAAALLLGTRSQGILLGGLFTLLATMRLAFALPAARLHALRLLYAGACFSAVLGIYPYLQNMRHHGNPFHPMILKVGNTRLFEGTYNAVEDLIATKNYTGTSNPTKALRRSWRVLRSSDWVFTEDRRGGWGPAFVFLFLPAMVVGVVVAVLKRHWAPALLAAGVLAYAHLAPDTWWIRLALYLPGVAIVMFGYVVAQAPRRFVLPLASVAVAISLLTAAEAAVCYVRFEAPFVREPAGSFLHSGDCIRPYSKWEDEHDFELYRWSRVEQEPGSTLVYFHPYSSGVYHYLFLREDLRSRAYGYTNNARDDDHLRRILARHQATYLMVQRYDEAFTYRFADAVGTLHRRFGKYEIYRVDPATIAPR